MGVNLIMGRFMSYGLYGNDPEEEEEKEKKRKRRKKKKKKKNGGGGGGGKRKENAQLALYILSVFFFMLTGVMASRTKTPVLPVLALTHSRLQSTRG